MIFLPLLPRVFLLFVHPPEHMVKRNMDKAKYTATQVECGRAEAEIKKLNEVLEVFGFRRIERRNNIGRVSSHRHLRF